MYETRNGSSNGTDLEVDMATEDYILAVIYAFICLFGIIGNILALIVVFYNPKMKTASSVFMFNLALADLLFLLSMPMTITTLLTRVWKFGHVMCRIHFGCFGINLFASVYTLVAMSLDRYVAICCIKWSQIRTIPNSVICCVCIWILAILLTLPIFIYSETTTNPETTKMQCNLNWPENQGSLTAFVSYTVTLGFVLPFHVITIFYVLIVIKLRKQSPALTDTSLENKNKRNRRVTVVVFCIIAAFVFCWLPYWCWQVILLTSGLPFSKLIITATHIVTLLFNCNSALNPILYGFLSHSFRKTMVKLFRCERSRSREGASSRMTSFLQTIRTHKSSSRRKPSALSETDAYRLQVHLDNAAKERATLLDHKKSTGND